MRETINDHDMDALNRYLDDLMDGDERAAFEQRLANEPPLAELYRQHQDVVSELSRAFSSDVGASRAVTEVMGRIDAEGEDAPADDQVDGGEGPYAPIASVGGTPWWRQAMAVAACVAVVCTVLYAGQRFSPFAPPAAPNATELYVQLVDNGFVAPSSCSPERFTDEMKEQTGQPLLLASLNPGIDLLGWSYPYFYGDPVIADDELVLMARVEGKPVMVLLHDDTASIPRKQPGMFVHHRKLGSLEGYEVGPFETPQLISLLSTP